MANLQYVALILLLTLNVAHSAFTPGCSFYNGQCVYNVKLGQEGQCNSVQQAASAAPSGSGHLNGGECTCNDVTLAKNDLVTLQGTVNQLQHAVDQLFKQLNLTKTELAQTNQQVATETAGNADLLSTLHLKELALNQTDHELASVLNTAGTEIKNLREQLQNATRDLNVCQGVVNPGSQSSVPALTGDYATFYCPFQDSHMCGFNHESGDDGNWLFNKAAHSGTGPEADHTYGTPSGYYMLMDAKTLGGSSSGHTRIFRLDSPSMKSSQNYCIKFWYNMYGSDVQNLNVYAKIHNGLGNPIFTRNGNQGLEWHLAEIDLNDEYTRNDFSIVFEATTNAYKSYTYSSSGGSHYVYHNQYGNIAIDDFYAYNTTCSSIPNCPPGSYKRTVGNVTSCLSFHSAPLSWFKANEDCKKESAHGHLMTIPNGQTQNYLLHLINNDIGLMAAGQSGYYISASDEWSEGSFVWTDTGTPYRVNYTSWHTGQPNNVASNQDCVLLEYPSADYEWGDVDCRTKHPYICEIEF
ncbi:MAM and LDL-receptor class A domain-containing protein 1-like [Ylistrum balloti]|uniref:MAM and LDL-receptor class A domain-containing protein 1-like n=1 Tax=Ylistrum balloti TaxID=509963 RepID=UPI002905AB4B|nr:MAM and LDL-receptor class A domain-containing protein 1-like [Ylistrum balloti]